MKRLLFAGLCLLPLLLAGCDLVDSGDKGSSKDNGGKTAGVEQT